jgi:hypothetical protein
LIPLQPNPYAQTGNHHIGPLGPSGARRLRAIEREPRIAARTRLTAYSRVHVALAPAVMLRAAPFRAERRHPEDDERFCGRLEPWRPAHFRFLLRRLAANQIYGTRDRAWRHAGDPGAIPQELSQPRCHGYSGTPAATFSTTRASCSACQTSEQRFRNSMPKM